MHLEHGQVAINVLDVLSNRFRHGRWVGARTRHDPDIARGSLAHRPEDFREWLPIKCVELEVGNDADDLRICEPYIRVLADRIFVGQESANERLVDHGDNRYRTYRPL